jgi:hypothetical protein
VKRWNRNGLAKFSQASFILTVLTSGCQTNPPPNCPCIQYNPQSVVRAPPLTCPLLAPFCVRRQAMGLHAAPHPARSVHDAEVDVYALCGC